MKNIFRFIPLIIFLSTTNLVYAACSYSNFDISNKHNLLTVPEAEGKHPLVIISPGGRSGGSLKGYRRWINF